MQKNDFKKNSAYALTLVMKSYKYITKTCTHPTTESHKGLRKSGRKWVCGSGNMNADDILSNMISLLTIVWKKLSVNLSKQYQIG